MPLIIFEKAKLEVFLKINSSFAKNPKIVIFFVFFMEYNGGWLKELYFKKI